jgi:ADP-ribose pyrophosphatase YjhB (NUDIX family)
MIKLFFNDRLLALSDKWGECGADVRAIAYKVTKKSDIEKALGFFLQQEQIPALYFVTDDVPETWTHVRSLFEPRVAAGGWVVNPAGEVLMIFRNRRWDLPKGHREAGESLEATALREVAEECGLGGLQLRRFLTTTYHLYAEESRMYLKSTDWFAMDYNGTEEPVPQTAEGISHVEWIPAARLPDVLSSGYASLSEVFRAYQASSPQE